MQSGGYRLFYIDSSSSEIVSEKYKPKGSTKEEIVKELLQALNKDPKSYGYKKVVSDDVVIKDYFFTDEEQVTVNFEVYNQSSKIAEVLSRAVIVKTLCQIPEVKYVEFTVNGQPLMDSYEKPVGIMTSEQFIDNTGAEANYYQYAYLNVYFANQKGDKLIASREQVLYKGTKTSEQLILQRLLDGPLETMKHMYPTVPSGTTLNNVTTKEGVCYVDFNSKFLNKIEHLTDQVAIYSIVNSLVELSTVNKVQFMIDGKIQETYREGTEFDTLFERDLNIVEGTN